jgi:ketosteroid isomerase-like protein
MSDSNVIRAVYAALNRNDISAMVSELDPQIEWIDPPELPSAATHRGHAAVKAHSERARGQWSAGSCEPERFIAAGDKVVVFVHVHVLLKTSTDWIDARIADVFTFRNGAIVQVRTFVDRAKALEWAGVQGAGAS